MQSHNLKFNFFLNNNVVGSLLSKNRNKVQDDFKLPSDSEGVPKPNRVVGGSIPNYEIVSLLDGKPPMSSSTS
jgi:hypothetical protein